MCINRLPCRGGEIGDTQRIQNPPEIMLHTGSSPVPGTLFLGDSMQKMKEKYDGVNNKSGSRARALRIHTSVTYTKTGNGNYALGGAVHNSQRNTAPHNLRRWKLCQAIAGTQHTDR